MSSPDTRGDGAPAEGSPDSGADAATLAAVELPWRRLHPLSPLLRGGIALIVVIGILVANLRDRVVELFFVEQIADSGDIEGGDLIDLVDYLARQRLLIWALLGVLLLVLVIVAVSWLSWRFSSFRITEEAVESRRGVLFRQHRRAPLERIQSVNLQRSLLARILGLTQVDVQTAGQGGKVALQYLGHKDAKLVREQILLAAAVSKAPTAAAAAAVVRNADLGLVGGPDGTGAPEAVDRVAGSGIGAGGASVAVDHQGQAYVETGSNLDRRLRDIADFDIDPGAREAGALIKVPLGRLIGSILLGSEMLSVVVIIAIIVALSIWSSPAALFGVLPLLIIMVSLTIAQFNKGFNFVLSRAADGVRVGAGLTSTTTETIPFGRVHAVMATQPLGWRIFGWWKVRITTAGYSASEAGQNKLQNVVLPVGTVDDVLRVFETLLHDQDGEAAQRQEALREALIGGGTGFLPPGRGAAWVLWLGVRRAGLRVEHPEREYASLRIRRGWFTRSLSVMPILRAQSVQLHRPFLHRVLGLATITAHTVLGPVRMQMRGIAFDDARSAFDELAATVVRVQGAEAERRAGLPERRAADQAAPPDAAEGTLEAGREAGE